MSNINLVDTAGGALFTVSDQDWAAIGQRVDSAINLSAIADEVSQYLPEFKALVSACRQWRDRTFPDVRGCAALLARYCGQALNTFGRLQGELAGPLTPAVQQHVVEALAELSTQTMPLNDRFHSLSGEIADFAEINASVDAQVDRYVDKLGQDWHSILPETTRVDDAAGRVRGIWQALSADLNALVSESIDVTEEFVISLQLQSALIGWQSLQSEAEQFLARHSAMSA